MNNIPLWYAFPYKNIDNCISFLFESNENLFFENYYKGCCQNIHINDILSFKIAEAIKIIKQVNSEIYTHITSIIDYIIPFGNEEEIEIARNKERSR